MSQVPKKVKSAIRNLDRLVPLLFALPDGSPLRLTDYQKRFIAKALTREPGKFILLSATRAGKTTATSVLATLYGILYPGEEIVVVAPTYKQTMILFDRIRFYFQTNPILHSLVGSKFTQVLIELVNGTKIRALSAGNAESLLGFGATVLIVDEAGSIPDDVYRTRIVRMLMSPTVKGRKPVLILLGTPHLLNHFYESYNSPDFWKMRVTWRDAVKAGVMKREEVEYARKIMTEAEFRMWFEAEFVPEEGTFFNPLRVRELAVVRTPRRDVKHLPGFRYYAGLDIARLGSDKSAYVVIEVTPDFSLNSGEAEVVAWYSVGKKTLNYVIGWAKNLTERWQPEILAVDPHGLGAGVLDVLREQLGTGVVGVGARGSERSDMYMFLRRLINEGRIRLPADDDFINQFNSYSIKYRSDGSVSIVKSARMHDDYIDALAMAVYAAGYLASVGEVAVIDSFEDYLNYTSNVFMRSGY